MARTMDEPFAQDWKAFYSPDEMVGKQVVFVENLKPRPLRGVVSEGMMLIDNGNGDVRLITIDGAIERQRSGSLNQSVIRSRTASMTSRDAVRMVSFICAPVLISVA